MTHTAQPLAPEQLEAQAHAAREQVDRTLQALEQRLSIKRRPSTASVAIGATAREVSRTLCPSITTLIRLDHSHVLAAFRRYRPYLPGPRKRAIVANICLSLEIHARLEEEIFYPALFSAGRGTDDLDKAITDHDDMQDLIAHLRQSSPQEAAYDELVHELMRRVLHHIADEETTLLPFAEIRLRERLHSLGWQMSVRRLELLKPHRVQAALTTAATFPILSGAVVLGAVYAGWWLLKAVAAPLRRVSSG